MEGSLSFLILSKGKLWYMTSFFNMPFSVGKSFKILIIMPLLPMVTGEILFLLIKTDFLYQ